MMHGTYNVKITHILQELNWQYTLRLVDKCLRNLEFCRVHKNDSYTSETVLLKHATGYRFYDFVHNHKTRMGLGQYARNL